MKKAIFFIIASIFLTACTTNDSYIDSLSQKQGNVSYIINVKVPNRYGEYISIKSYIKGDKWKTYWLNKGKVYSLYSYNGVDKIYKYNTETKNL